LIARERILPATDIFRPHVKSTPGLKVGQWLFVAGQVARDAEGNPLGEGNVVAQTHHAMQNLIVVLREGGATLAHVVKMTLWVTDMSSIADVQAARREYFPDFVPPSATLGVCRLVDRRHLIEIDALAIVD
jgi:enamine deaminase RidA (YjgF/YER057c/UK114 family)